MTTESTPHAPDQTPATETSCSDRDDFLRQVRAAGIATVIVAWRDEWAPSTATAGVAHGDVRFGPMHDLLVLAYRRGHLLRWQPPADTKRDDVARDLRELGLRVELRSRNIS